MNLFDYTTPQQGEVLNTLLEHKNIKIVRIISASNFESTLYCQAEDEWVVVLEGEARLRVGEEETILSRGDSLLIPAHTPHRIVEMQQGTLWLAIHIE